MLQTWRKMFLGCIIGQNPAISQVPEFFLPLAKMANPQKNITYTYVCKQVLDNSI